MPPRREMQTVEGESNRIETRWRVDYPHTNFVSGLTRLPRAGLLFLIAKKFTAENANGSFSLCAVRLCGEVMEKQNG